MAIFLLKSLFWGLKCSLCVSIEPLALMPARDITFGAFSAPLYQERIKIQNPIFPSKSGFQA
jgi:hypothetical protein